MSQSQQTEKKEENAVTRKEYPLVRYILYTALIFLAVYMILSGLISTTIVVLGEARREQSLPVRDQILVNDDQEASICLSRLDGFYRDLLENAERFASRYRYRPDKAGPMWDEFLVNWQDDYRRLGDVYTFTHSLSPQPEESRQSSQLRRFYWQIKRVQEKLNGSYQALIELHQTDKQNVERDLEQLKLHYMADQ